MSDATAAGRGATAPRLIVFDLDGTLVDSRQDLVNAANELVVRRGGTPLPDEAVVAMVGEGAALLVRRALAAAGLDPEAPGSLETFLEIYDRRLLEHTRPYEGVREMLEALKDRAVLAVVTNKPLAHTRALLDALKLTRFFDAVGGGDGPWPRKPNPAALVALRGRRGVPSDGTLMVGDSWIDLETARNAGARVCLARYGFGFAGIAPGRLRGDEWIIDRPADLPRVLSEMGWIRGE